MAQTLRDIMTGDPITLAADTTMIEAARAMRQHDIGDVLVTQGNGVCGIVTDRDLVVRGLAEGCDPFATKIGDLCTRDLVTAGPDTKVDEAARIMREQALRRLPVVDGGQPIGIVSIGDLAQEKEKAAGPAQADISAAPAND